jgi:radical SAM protein with 4Fe4S-binding SPASM domain
MKEVGIIPSLSTNGGLIEDRHLPLIQEHFDYVGISIDGPELIHDRFRGKSGAFKKSLGAIRKCRDSGLKVGIRFTICKETFSGLSFVFELAEKEGIPKIYLSHLVDSGRADTVEDLAMDDYKEGVQFIIKKAFSYVENGIGIDVVTGNNEADGVVLYREFQKRFPAQEDVLYKNLQTWGGNQAGVRLVNIDYLGNVKPDPFFPDSLGNLREKTFSEIWEDAALLGPLRNRPRILEGKCGSCTYLNICNGGSRARAFSRYGSYSAEDPACHVMSQ